MRIRGLFAAVMVLHAVYGFADEWTSYTTDDGLIYDDIIDIDIDVNNTKWILQYDNYYPGGALSTFDGISWEEPITAYDLPFNNPQDDDPWFHMVAVLIDHMNTIWLVSPGALCSYIDGNIEQVVDTERIRQGFVDNENNIWLYQGASFGPFGDTIAPSKNYLYNGETITEALEGNTASSIAFDSHNNAWWCWDGTLYMYNGSEINTFVLSENNEHILSYIMVDKHDIKWMFIYKTSDTDSSRTPVGLASYNNTEWTIYPLDHTQYPNLYGFSCKTVDKNDIMWIGTYNNGLLRFDGSTYTLFTTENSGLVNNYVKCLAVEKNNTLWIGTEGGLCKYTGEAITAIDEEPKPEALPTVTSYPNPFNPSTTISFTLPESEHASLTVYNLAGQKVRTLADEAMAAGNHTILWDGTDDAGNAVAAGVYVTRMTVGGSVATGKMVLVK